MDRRGGGKRDFQQRPGPTLYNNKFRRGTGAFRGRGAPPEDYEGNINMGEAVGGDGAGSFRGGRGGRFPARGPYARGPFRGVNQDIRDRRSPPANESGFKIKIEGLPQGLSNRESVDIIRQYVQFTYLPKTLYTRDNATYFSVASRLEFDQILALSGTEYEGTRLNVTEDRLKHAIRPGRPPIPTSEEIAVFLKAHYDEASGVLSLAALASQPEFQNKTVDLNLKMVPNRIVRIIDTVCPKVVTIDLSRNNLKTLEHFNELHTSAPAVQNLSFDTNSIQEFKELDHLKNLNPRELLFLNNPITAKAAYREEVQARFKSLKYLDREPVKPVISFPLLDHVVSAPINLPPIQGSYFDVATSQQLAESFASRYFNLFDTHREGLLNVYSDRSCFSLSTDTQQGGRDPLVRWFRYNRNLEKIKDANTRVNLLNMGALEILSVLAKFPKTQHLSESLCVDCCLLNGLMPGVVLLQLSVHGTFVEVAANSGETDAQIFFDRVFLLIPAIPGSPAAAAGWPAVILNDQLHLRHRDARSSSPSPFPVVPPAALPPTLPTVAYPPTEQPSLQELMTVDFMKATSCTKEVAESFLASCGWNAAEASAKLSQMQAQGVVLLPSATR
mmetsp:Transcript_40140/g.65082  ORF Transcript_40140/g.65082 Transcript_40140/m.65082 type:complete len:615 (+) Transcript_40140:183-2027(+)|eukprot:CAMPEP_0184647414 /NCGR_PEP_ID=MMETSP0308-20130426/4327_1 /TAXON_ID=38269 /ORGANISM="Gloeochaete witrockiana, Strain SAG 46.84" /LENGTH=614 /DNA_ID=CAMNT_0027078337 /DNA_START=140 /DNA_END=1984 /DNA_ORIENTATION=+